MPRFLLLTIALLFAAHFPARAEDDLWHAPPDHLTIGYEDEGKVDASEQGCATFVREMVEWTEADTQKGIEKVCAARKRHVQAYAELQQSYAALNAYLMQDHRLNSADAIKSFEGMIKNCIDHKSNITTGGHNITSDIIPNDNAAACLKIGKQLLDAETAWFKVGFSEASPAP